MWRQMDREKGDRLFAVREHKQEESTLPRLTAAGNMLIGDSSFLPLGPQWQITPRVTRVLILRLQITFSE